MKLRWSLAPVVAGLVASTALAAPAHAIGPTINSVQLSSYSVAPIVDGLLDTVDVSGTATTGVTTVHIDVSASDTGDGAPILTVDVTADGAGNFQTTLGQNLLDHVTSSGYYDVWARPDGVTDPTSWAHTSLFVSLKRLVTKTWTTTLSAAGSKIGQYIGRCSTLRKPSLRGWSGSFGYYSNTRCARAGSRSVVVTAHMARLRAVEYPGGYDTVRIVAYGGAARSKPRSRAYLGYYSADGTDVVAGSTLAAKVGTHAGPAVAASLVNDEQSVRWFAGVRAGNRYDIKRFTLILTYKVFE